METETCTTWIILDNAILFALNDILASVEHFRELGDFFIAYCATHLSALAQFNAAFATKWKMHTWHSQVSSFSTWTYYTGEVMSRWSTRFWCLGCRIFVWKLWFKVKRSSVLHLAAFCCVIDSCCRQGISTSTHFWVAFVVGCWKIVLKGSFVGLIFLLLRCVDIDVFLAHYPFLQFLPTINWFAYCICATHIFLNWIRYHPPFGLPQPLCLLYFLLFLVLLSFDISAFNLLPSFDLFAQFLVC